MQMRLKSHLRLTGVMKAETGLHVGGVADKVEIGGADDNPIILNPLTEKPYIPGKCHRLPPPGARHPILSESDTGGA